MGRAWLSWALACGLSLVAASAVAQEDARTVFARGQTAYQQGDYDTAIREWNTAYQLDPRPLIQLNLAQAYERLGRLDEAAAALDRYLETATPDDPNQADARARRSAIRERIAQTAVTISGAPDGATIEIDGTAYGATPRPDSIHLDAGSHRIVLRLAGYRDFTSTVVVSSGQTVDVPVQMEEGGSAEGGGGGSILPYIAFGAAGAFAITGTIFGLGAMGKANDATSSEGDDADAARGLALGADVFFGLGVVSAGVGVLLLVLDDDGGGEESAMRVVPYASATEVGAAMSGGF